MEPITTNTIKEVSAGVYRTVLWCPESAILAELLDPEMPFVLCWDHDVGDYTWREFSLPLVERLHCEEVLSRVAQFDFILSTDKFLALLPSMKRRIKAVQLGRIPPDYLDMRRIKGGKELYRLLGECGWHVLLETSAIDYGVVLSPRREVVERAIALHLAREASESERSTASESVLRTHPLGSSSDRRRGGGAPRSGRPRLPP